jgi:hypothetical protein
MVVLQLLLLLLPGPLLLLLLEMPCIRLKRTIRRS